MRIIAGVHRGLVLASAGKGAGRLRPTASRVRESLFNILTGGSFGNPLVGAHVLDLFAGTGALGIEALSRGATHATFIDNARKAQCLIGKNVDLCGRRADAKILRCDATRLPANPGTTCDLVFLDPPYRKGLGERALASALAEGWIADAALIVWEEAVPITAPTECAILDRRKYGDTSISVLEVRRASVPARAE